MTKKLIWLALAFAIVIAIAVPLKLYHQPIESIATAQDSFIINVPYEKVRAILIQTKATPKLVAANHGVLIEQSWTGGTLDIGPKPLRDQNWKLHAEGTLKIKMNDERIGSPTGFFHQNVDVDSNGMKIFTYLAEPSGPMIDYQNEILISRHTGNTTKVSMNLYLKISYEHFPLKKICQIIDKNVQESANSIMENTKDEFQRIIEEHKDAIFILEL